MEEILKFVQTYWREILEVVTLLATFLVFLCKKVKVENPSIISFIDDVLPSVINAAEIRIGDGKGDEKKQIVMDAVLKAIKTSFSNIDEKKYKEIVNNKIELILSTPQKKGVSL